MVEKCEGVALGGGSRITPHMGSLMSLEGGGVGVLLVEFIGVIGSVCFCLWPPRTDKEEIVANMNLLCLE